MSLYSKMSPTAKLLSWVIALPAIGIALYLYWSGSDVMAWVDGARDTVVSENTSARRTNKIGFVIVLFSVGIPAMIPAFAYDFFKKDGLFGK